MPGVLKQQERDARLKMRSAFWLSISAAADINITLLIAQRWCQLQVGMVRWKVAEMIVDYKAHIAMPEIEEFQNGTLKSGSMS